MFHSNLIRLMRRSRTYHHLLPSSLHESRRVRLPSDRAVNNLRIDSRLSGDFRDDGGHSSQPNPFRGASPYNRNGIQKQVNFVDNFRKWRHNHDASQTNQGRCWEAEGHLYRSMPTIRSTRSRAVRVAAKRMGSSSRTGVLEPDHRGRRLPAWPSTSSDCLSLRHNFYRTSTGKLHMEEGRVSASVMDYVASCGRSRFGADLWEILAQSLRWIYGGSTKRDEMMKKDLLYCTDEHRRTHRFVRRTIWA